LAKKQPKQPLTSMGANKNIAPYIIMAIMAGISLGITGTYIFMSQTTPLREELRETKKNF
jgi:formate/nitrite transporter FocA (FNT family)